MQKVSYVEAVKKGEEEGSRGKEPERIPVSSRSVSVQRDKSICFSKIVFLAFKSMVINCTTEMECK